jgi:diphthamide synthase (EF-2-diphthine--ammonia ligase)
MSNLPGIKYKVIGLVSGGKDSTFNLLHCVANGHDLVALATLTPEAGIGMSQAGRPSIIGALADLQMS